MYLFIVISCTLYIVTLNSMKMCMIFYLIYKQVIVSCQTQTSQCVK